ncbi:LPXTG-domain-containing protein [Seiridium cupressi]
MGVVCLHVSVLAAERRTSFYVLRKHPGRNRGGDNWVVAGGTVIDEPNIAGPPTLPQLLRNFGASCKASFSAWCFACAAPLSSLATVITSLVMFNDDTYIPERWHTSLIMIATMIIPLLSNLWFRKILGALESFAGILHICLFVVFIAILAAMGPKGDSDFVFKTLTHDLSATFSLSGVDGAIHMIVLLFFLGPIENAANALLPLFYVLHGATKSKRTTTALVVLMSWLYFTAMFNVFASVSRLIRPFAKDQGMPSSNFFSYGHPTLEVPTNALMLLGLIVTLLSLIYIGSVTAFKAIISLQALGLYFSYIFPILFILLRKLRGPTPPFGPFKIGAWDVPVNIFALCYLLFIITWMPFPSALPVDKEHMHYVGPIFGGILLLAPIDWSLNGRKRFQVPVKKYE